MDLTAHTAAVSLSRLSFTNPEEDNARLLDLNSHLWCKTYYCIGSTQQAGQPPPE